MFPVAMMQPGPGGTGTGGGVSIGDAIGSATVGRGLFVDTGGVIGQNAAFTFDKVTGTLAATLLKASGLTSGRVPIVGAAGLIGDDAGLLYNATTDTLTAGALVLSGKITGLTQGTASGEAIHAARSVSTGTGLTGGGNLTADRTLSVDVAAALTWSVAQTFALEDAGTNTVLRPIVVRRTTSGTAAASLGVGIAYELEDASGNTDAIGSIDLLSQDPANASEDTVLDFRTMVGGTITDLFRVGGAAGVITAPDVDATLAMGRVLMDSRVPDRAHFSHRDMTSTANYALQQSAAGGTILNAPSGQILVLANNASQKMRIDSTGIAFYATATTVALQTVTGSRATAAAIADLLTKLANLGLIVDGTTA